WEECLREEDSAYAGRPYRGTLYFRWARLFVDRRFTYANLSMAAGFLLGELEQQLDETLDALVPHRIVPTRVHGRREGEGYTWDMCVEAAGKETILEDLQELAYDYQRRRHAELADRWDRATARGVFVRACDSIDGNRADFIFTDKTALEAV